MRNISTAMRNWLTSAQLTAAICVKLVRTDGVTMGFTSFDRNLSFDGLLYEASNAIVASTSKQSVGTTVDNLSINGILRSDRITETDVLAGLYDGASLELFLVNYLDLTMGKCVLQSGQLGQIRLTEGQFFCEMRSLRQHWQQQILELTGFGCRANFGDSRCKKVLTGTTVGGQNITSTGTVVSVQSPLILALSGIVDSAGFYSYGLINFTSGANAGLGKEIKTHGTAPTNTYSVGSAPSNFSVPFTNQSPHAPTRTTTFAIPAGTWTDAYLSIVTSWTARNSDNTTPDALFVSVPTGYANEMPVTAQAFTGVVDSTVELISQISAIQSAAGGNLTVGWRLYNSAGQHMNVNVTRATLTLTGTESGISNVIVLQEAFPFPIQTGDQATLIAGCDRNFTTCVNKYNNAVNYRGEPHVPGLDKIIRVGRTGS